MRRATPHLGHAAPIASPPPPRTHQHHAAAAAAAEAAAAEAAAAAAEVGKEVEVEVEVEVGKEGSEGTGSREEEGLVGQLQGMQLPYQLFVPGRDTTIAIVVSSAPASAAPVALGCPMQPIHQWHIPQPRGNSCAIGPGGRSLLFPRGTAAVVAINDLDRDAPTEVFPPSCAHACYVLIDTF